MTEEIITLSHTEIDRISVIRSIITGFAGVKTGLALHFSSTETTQAYMQTLNQQLDKYGRPGAMYSDKHSIFRVNHVDKEGELIQFTRALKTLDIEPIHANTPQAKGRVERANKTLQDRLVKEMRLQGITGFCSSTIAPALSNKLHPCNDAKPAYDRHGWRKCK